AIDRPAGRAGAGPPPLCHHDPGGPAAFRGDSNAGRGLHTVGDPGEPALAGGYPRGRSARKRLRLPPPHPGRDRDLAGRLCAGRARGKERAGRETRRVRRVHVLVEGQTEETFIRDVLAPHLASREVYLTPVLAATKRIKSGLKF